MEKSNVGRPKGSKSTDALLYQEYFVKNNICVPDLEVYVLKETLTKYNNYSELAAEATGLEATIELEMLASDYLKMYQEQVKLIANRLYPKLKSIDHQIPKLTDDMTEDEQIELLTTMLNKLNERKQNRQSTSK